MKINPSQDQFQGYPALKKVNAVLHRVYVEPSIFEERDDKGETVLDEQGEAIHLDAVKAEATFTYYDENGDEREGRMTDEVNRGVLRLLRNLSPDGESEWVDKLPADAEGNLELPEDEERNVLINGVAVADWDVTLDVSRRQKGDRVYNGIRNIRLPG